MEAITWADLVGCAAVMVVLAIHVRTRFANAERKLHLELIQAQYEFAIANTRPEPRKLKVAEDGNGKAEYATVDEFQSPPKKKEYQPGQWRG